jgi:leader peptidase (prepilin peptidase)/N-methyltransferase
MVIFFIFLIGLCLGSFMNVLIYRLPREESVVYPPSFCPNCGERLKAYDNVPLLGFLFLKGKCRYCDNKISIRYPVVELTTGILISTVYYKFGFSLESLKYSILFFLLLAAAWTDYFTSIDEENFECGIIPDEITIGGIIIGLIFAFIMSYKFFPVIFNLFAHLNFYNFFKIISLPPVYNIVGVICGFLILWLPAFLFQLITKKEGMGGGDIKLFMMIGAFLGWKPLFFILFCSSLIGTLIGIPMIILKRNRDYMIPYGPFISLATMFYIYCGDFIINKYLQIITH